MVKKHIPWAFRSSDTERNFTAIQYYKLPDALKRQKNFKYVFEMIPQEDLDKFFRCIGSDEHALVHPDWAYQTIRWVSSKGETFIWVNHAPVLVDDGVD